MTTRPDTWMPMYWGDYARDTGHLNATGHGAYLMLIKHYWCTGLPLVDDDDELWRIACCDSKKEWLKLRPRIVRMFVKDGAHLRHKRIDHEMQTSDRITEQRRAAGRASAEARKAQQSGNENPTADERSLNEMGNENPTGAATLVDDPLPGPLQRNGRQSQPQSHLQSGREDSGSLRSPGAGAPAVRPIKDVCWQDGLPIIRSLIGCSESQARSFLGKMAKESHNDFARVYSALREAESLRPVDPSAWLMRAAAGQSAPLFNPRKLTGALAVLHAIRSEPADGD